jgi:thermostable 8-oxoguanine DNA glycosylase
MEIFWVITQRDIDAVKKFVEQNQNPFVSARIRRNIFKEDLEINEDSVLRSMVMCILTSQQRSGPNTSVGRFLQTDPFPITFEALNNTGDPEEFVRTTLQSNGLNRYINKIPKFLVSNYKFLQTSNWQLINLIKEHLKSESNNKSERELANYINDNFQGFGPKQSRNFLQTLGITRFEIPIDSRITSWLNNFGFPVTLTTTALQDREYYEFVSKGIQNLCENAGILPCVLDAAIFSSFDKGQWTAENTIY